MSNEYGEIMSELKLKSITSSEVNINTWSPLSKEDVFLCLDLEISWSDNEGAANLFYVTLSTPEALRKHRSSVLLVRNRTLVVSEYDYDEIRTEILKILDECSKESWESSCFHLQRFFLWEYEDYSEELLT